LRRMILNARIVEMPRIDSGDHSDAIVSGAAIRGMPNDRRSYVLMARFPMLPKIYTRRALRDIRVVSLDEARENPHRPDFHLLVERGLLEPRSVAVNR
jgi:hypothetical protein